DAILSVEFSSDMEDGSWSGSGASLIFVGTINDADGILRHTYRLSTPSDSTSRRFFRLKVVY
ncbi:MAG: hypothetical protein ABF380_11015, partial [Akkermansiaceae bacterium]